MANSKVKVLKKEIYLENWAEYPFRDIIIDEDKKLIYATILYEDGYNNRNEDFESDFDIEYKRILSEIVEEYDCKEIKDLEDDENNYIRSCLFSY